MSNKKTTAAVVFWGSKREAAGRCCRATLLTGFELGNAGLKGFQLGAGAGEYFLLHVEFFTRHQVQLGKGGAEYGLDVLLYVLQRAIGNQANRACRKCR